MTDWDRKLIKDAGATKFKDYQLVFGMIELADTSECERVLSDIGEMLFEFHTKGRLD